MANAFNARLNGITVPRWLVTAILASAALLGAGYAVGHRESRLIADMESLHLRMCRVEVALAIVPWVGCPRNSP